MHVWFSKDGMCVRKLGTTILASLNQKEDEKAGTGEVRVRPQGSSHIHCHTLPHCRTLPHTATLPSGPP